jgi:accessory gene regulator B
LETLAKNIAEKIALQMDFDEDKKAVIGYGLTAIFQMVTIFMIISVFGILFHFWYESILIFFGVGIIRKSTGGAHSETMNGCIIISVLSVTMLSALSRYLLGFPMNRFANSVFSVIIYILCLIVFYYRVPVDSPNKPIVKPEKIRRLRRQSFLIITVFFLSSVAFIFFSTGNNRFYSIAVSIRLTMLWQLLTLTAAGARFFGNIDSKYKKLIEKI